MKKSSLAGFQLLFCFSLLFTACSSSPEKSKARKPNIIYIMADDLGYGDLGVYGQERIRTPHIDSLAAEGMLFTQFYAGSTVCAPSRSCLMTGLHTGHTRVRGNADVPLATSDSTVAEFMKKAGYTTGMIGKWGLGLDKSTGMPNKKGFDYFYGYLDQTRAHNYYPAYLWENDQVDSLENKVELVSNAGSVGVGGISTNKAQYSADLFLEKTLDFINRNKDSSFFLYLPYTLPHANNEARRFNQSGMEVPSLGIYADSSWPYDQKAHAAMISYLDTQVGKIMEHLRELGLDENTLLIFTSDNGPHNEGGADSKYFSSAGPLRGLKRDMYEGGIRVPFIARWPNHIAPNSRSNFAGAFWDLLPTFCELAGVIPPDNIDGISFLPALEGKKQPSHAFLYWEFFEQGGKQAVRFNNWKCIRLDVDKEEGSRTELYDLATDIGEKTDLAKEKPALVDSALQLMEQAHSYSADFHFRNEKE